MAALPADVNALVDRLVVAYAAAFGADVSIDLSNEDDDVSSNSSFDEDSNDSSDVDVPIGAEERKERRRLSRAKWDLVAQCVQTSLHGFATTSRSHQLHPQAKLFPATTHTATAILQEAMNPKHSQHSHRTVGGYANIDFALFSARLCQQRVRYCVWRAKREADEAEAEVRSRRTAKKASSRPKPSGFNIVQGDSLTATVEAIMAKARESLPSTNRSKKVSSEKEEEIESSSEDENAPLEVFQPSNFMTEEELAAHAEAQQAEDDLMQKVQELQVQHFQRFRKWIELGTGEATSPPPSIYYHNGVTLDDIAKQKQRQQKQEEEKLLSQQEFFRKFKTFSPSQLGDWLEEIGISQHSSRFQRTTGAILLSMSKGDIKERMHPDVEGADILWHHLERVKEGKPQSDSAVARLYKATKAPTSDWQTQSEQLKRVEHEHQKASGLGTHSSVAAIEHQLAQGDLSGLKAALANAPAANRPLRPSQMTDAEQEAVALARYGDQTLPDDDWNELAQKYQAQLVKKQQPGASSAPVPKKQQHTDPVNTGGGAAAAAAQRKDRWQVIEYSEDEEENN